LIKQSLFKTDTLLKL